MKRQVKKWLNRAFMALVVASLLLSASVYAEPAGEADFLSYLVDTFSEPEKEYYPEVRWWMAEGTHTDETLLEEIAYLAESGFGAVEFLAMSVYGSNSETYGWGSEEWKHDTELIIEAATENGLGFSLTSGTNWGTANLPDTYIYDGEAITPDHPATAKQLSYQTVQVKAGEHYTGELKQHDWTGEKITRQQLESVVAVGMIDAQTLDYEDAHVITDSCEETQDGVKIDWTAPEQNAEYAIFAFWMHGTNEISEPSVSYNYTINYVDPYGVEALIDYWENEVLTPELKALIQENGRGEMYMDSLECEVIPETGGLFWGETYAAEFEARRGYSVEPYLPFLLNTTSGRSSNGLDYLYNNLDENGWSADERIHQLRNDFFQTNTELYIENVLEPLQAWLHSLGMSLRAEISYGGNFYDISQPGKYVDGIETESLEFATQVDSYRNFSGVANLYHKTLSSETGAVMSGLMETMFGDPIAGIYSGEFDRLNQILYTQFAAGISRNVFHTYTSQWGPSEELAQWPGYIGNQETPWPERIGERQPSALHYDIWTQMIARNQKMLRQGLPRVDVGILRSDYMLNCNLSGVTYEDTDGFRSGRGLYFDISLQDAGYSYDYFSPTILLNENEAGERDVQMEDGLVQPDGPGYQALIVYQEELPLESARTLLEWAGGDEKLPIVFVNNCSELGRAYGYGGGELSVTHGQAASRTPYNNSGETDAQAELEAVVAQIKALDNVIEIDDATQIVDALEQLGVTPRASFESSNHNLLTNLRLDADNDALYLYVYNYMPGHTNMRDDTAIGEDFTQKISIEGVGTPYLIDSWTGEVTALADYQIDGGRTTVEISLAPGATTILALNLDADADSQLHVLDSDAEGSFVRDGGIQLLATETGSYTTQLSDGSTVTSDVEVFAPLALDSWDLTIETWTQGDLVTRVEENPEFDHSTTEYKYETVKEEVHFEDLSALKSWAELGVNASGVGSYTTRFRLPDGWQENNGAILKLGSIYRASAVLYVNGTRIPLPLESLEVDITDYLKADAENEIVVEVCTNLQNSVKADVLEPLDALQNYGLVGENQLIFYTACPVTSA